MQEAGKLALIDDSADAIDVPGKESHRIIIPWCYNLMKMLSMYDEFLSKISSDFINVGGVRTAYYFYNGNSNKTILLIHGIGGDFHGMIPLAYRLRDDANLLFVDLPSHGKSQLIANMEVKNILQKYKTCYGVVKVQKAPGCVTPQNPCCPCLMWSNVTPCPSGEVCNARNSKCEADLTPLCGNDCKPFSIVILPDTQYYVDSSRTTGGF